MATQQKTIADRLGLRKFAHDIVHRRHRFRQFTGIVFLIVLTILGKPIAILFYSGVALAGLGIAVRLWASGHVKKDKVLATTGPYSLVRHPLYVGNHLLMAGFCLASGLWWSFLVWAFISFYFYPQTIRHEDQLLSRLFPDQWGPWARETRALIPRLKPYGGGLGGDWSFEQSLRQNGEPIIAGLLVWWLYILYSRLPPA